MLLLAATDTHSLCSTSLVLASNTLRMLCPRCHSLPMCYPHYQRSSTQTALLKLLLAHSACTRCNANDRCRYWLFLSPATAQRRPRFSPPKIPHHHATRSMTLAGHATWLMPYYSASQATRCPTPPQATLPKLFAAHAIAAGMQQPGAHTTLRKLHMFLTAHTKQLDCRPSHTSFRQHSLHTLPTLTTPGKG